MVVGSAVQQRFRYGEILSSFLPHRDQSQSPISIWALECTLLRHYKGAGVAEIDILEFFTKAFGENLYPPKRIKPCICSIRNAKLGINLPKGQIRYTEIGDDKPGDNFHVYAVQIDPDPVDNNHAIITFLIDNKVNYQIHTRTQLGDAYTDFITKGS